MNTKTLKVLSPIVEQYALTVSVPMEMPLVIPKDQSIYSAEYSFTVKRDRVSDHARKVELDRARAVLKYASCCGATLNEMHNADHKLKITLGFTSIESLINFRDTMGSAVSSATMK